MNGAVPISGAVLAGGRSRRMGRDKRLIDVAGEPLLARTVRVLAEVVDDTNVVVAGPEDRALVAMTLVGHRGTGIAIDARPDVGPAAGLEVALASAAHPWVLVVATDHPGLSPEVLGLIATAARAEPDDGAAAVALPGARGPEPLLAAYRRDALSTVTGLLDAGARRLVDVLAALDPRILGRDAVAAVDPDGAALHDVDVPEDLPEPSEEPS